MPMPWEDFNEGFAVADFDLCYVPDDDPFWDEMEELKRLREKRDGEPEGVE